MHLILTIDGGGTRGVIPATWLQRLSEDLGKPPRALFYLMAGTSTGGILCTGYAAGVRPDTLVDLYFNKARRIFQDSLFDDLRDGFGKNFGADYTNRTLKSELTKVFGQRTLHDIHQQNFPEGHSRLMVCTFDLNPQRDGQPVNFRPRVYHSEFRRDAEESLVDLCLKTSAGPTYFPIYKNHIDGGVTMNNPAMAALAYALNTGKSDKAEYRHPDGAAKGLGLSPDDVKILSLGCGTSNRNYIPAEKIARKDNGDWGNVDWLPYLPDMLTETNMQAADYYVRQVLGAERYLRLQLYFDRDEAPAEIKKVVHRKRTPLGLDVKDKSLLRAMVAYANEEYDRRREDLLRFLGHD